MKIGCSECICIAIESHRTVLLKRLLLRSNVQYRDIFWAPAPPRDSWQIIEEEQKLFPILHDMSSEMDLSIVGSDDCGHVRVDVELSSSCDLFLNARAYILVSLPLIARWHTSERFNAERMLRESGKFDYSEPQFFNVMCPYVVIGHRKDLLGPLNWYSYSIITMCNYETRNNYRNVSLDSSTQKVSLCEPSSLPCHMAIVRVVISVFIGKDQIDIEKFYGQLSSVFCAHQFHICRAKILEKIQKILECGTDLNQFLLSRHVDWFDSTSHYWGNFF